MSVWGESIVLSLWTGDKDSFRAPVAGLKSLPEASARFIAEANLKIFEEAFRSMVASFPRRRRGMEFAAQESTAGVGKGFVERPISSALAHPGWSLH